MLVLKQGAQFEIWDGWVLFYYDAVTVLWQIYMYCAIKVCMTRHQVVKVCIAMMLPLICLTGTPSNRTSRVRMDRVADRRVTMDYSFVIQTVIVVVTQAVPAESARGQ